MPYPHVDHVHSDAVIAIAASADSEKLTKEIFGDEMGYLPWQRPGIDLGIKLGEMARNNPQFVGVVLGSHGLFTWGNTAKDCYDTTLRIINKAAVWLDRNREKPAFKGAKLEALPEEGRRAVALRLLPDDPRTDFEARAQDRALRRFARSAGVREFQHAGRPGAARHLLPGPLPAHQDPPADRAA